MELGYRLNKFLCAGITLDNAISHAMPALYEVTSSNPSFGAFVSLRQREDGTGAKFHVSAATSSMGLMVTREVIGHTEAGVGSTDLNGNGVQGELSWGWKVGENWLMEPYAGMRYMKIERKGYTETSGADFPVTYDDTAFEATTFTAGVKMSGKLSKQLGVRIGAGLEHDVHNRMDATTGSIRDLGAFSISSPGCDRTRAVASVGTWYAMGENQQLGFDIAYTGHELDSSSAMQVAMTYSIGF